MSMSHARFQSIFNGQTTIAQKVYYAVPQQDEWSPEQIATELGRTGVTPDMRILQGCLKALVEAGLVNRTGKLGAYEYQREPVREPRAKVTVLTITQKEKPEMNPTTIAAAPKSIIETLPANPIDRLGELAQALSHLGEQMKMIGSQIADTAIEIQQQMESESDQLKKVKQLGELMKSLGIAA